MIRFERYFVLILLILSAAIHFLLFQYHGIRNLYDAEFYVEGADFLLRYNTLEDVHHVFYVIPISLIAFFRWLFPNQIMPYIIFQIIISSLAMISLYFSSSRIFNNKLAGLITGLIFLFWWDNIHWNITTMTESLACSATCFVIHRLALFQNRTKDYWWIIVLMIISFFIRPTGVIIIISTVAFILVYNWQLLKLKPFIKISVLGSIFIISCISAGMMFSKWDFTEQLYEGNIITYMNTIEGKPLYNESMRVDTKDLEVTDSIHHPAFKIVSYIYYNPTHFLKTASLKIWYLVSFYRPYYSMAHIFYVLLWTGLIYLLYYFGFVNVLSPIKFFTLAVIVVNCALIGIATVDWDNRFYIPMEPGIVLLAGGGAVHLLKRVDSFIRARPNVN